RRTLWQRITPGFRKHPEGPSLRDIQCAPLATDPDYGEDSPQNPLRCRELVRQDLRAARRKRHRRRRTAIRPAPRILWNGRLRFLNHRARWPFFLDRTRTLLT